MASKKISELTVLTGGTDQTDVVAVVDTSETETKQLSIRELFETSTDCTIIGSGAAPSLTGVDNVIVGVDAADAATSMSNSVVMGTDAVGTGVATGANNVVIGHSAGRSMTSANSSVLVGTNAGVALTSGASNILIGTNAGDVFTSGTLNTVIGTNAAGNTTNTVSSVFIGYGAYGASASQANGDVMIGYDAGRFCTSAKNVFVGYQTGRNISSGDNVIIGYQAGDTATSMASSVVIGKDAVGTGAATGDNHVIIGEGAGAALTSGTSNVFLGYNAGAQLTTESNQLVIANSNTLTPLISGDFSAETLNLNAEVSHKEAWEDSIQPFSSARGNGTTEPVWSDMGNGLYAMLFTPGDELFVAHHVPHNYALGTDAYPHVHFLSDSTETAGSTITWRMSYVIAKGHGQGQSLTGTPTVIDVTYTYDGTEVAGEHLVAECSDLQAFDLIEPDVIVMISVELLSETVSGDIFGIMSDLHYQIDRIGTPQKAPDFYA